MNEDVHAPESALDLAEDRLGTVPGRQVGRKEQFPRVTLARRRACRRHDGRAPGHEPTCDGAPDSLRATGHERALAGELARIE